MSVPGEAGAVRGAVERVLSSRHAVSLAAGGAEALALLDAGERFDVVLCDLTMPGMTGVDLYRAVAARHPDVAARFVFLTGGAFTPEAQQFLDATGAPRVAKPFDAAGLRAVVASRIP
jgi:CheY-like chemotaxis protein